MSKIEDILISFTAWLYYLFLLVVNKTLRVQVFGEEHPEGKNCLFALWHRSTFVPFYYHRDKEDVALLASGRRGEFLTRTVRKFGYQIIRVPSDENSREGAKAILQMLKALKRGRDGVVAVDGPFGPLYKVKPGIIYLGSKGGCPIVPVGIGASAKIVLRRRWDRYFVPLPFSRVIFVFGKPLLLPEKLPLEAVQEKCEELEKGLLESTAQAEKLVS